MPALLKISFCFVFLWGCFSSPVFADSPSSEPIGPSGASSASCDIELTNAAGALSGEPARVARGRRAVRLLLAGGVLTATGAVLIMKSPLALGYLGVVACVSCMSGVASASEAAILSADRQEIERKAREGDRAAQRLLNVLDDLDSYIPTLVVMNNLVNTPGAIVMGAVGEGVVGSFWSTVVSTLAIMLYGEDLSKGIGVQKSEAIAKLAATALPVIRRVVSPLIWVMNKNSNFMRNRITDMTLGRISFNQPEAEGRRAQLLNYLEYVHNIGAINGQEYRFLSSILRFRDKKMEEIVEFDREIRYLRDSQSVEQALDEIRELNYTRYPVLGEQGELVGLVTKYDLERAARDSRHSHLKVREYMSVSVTSVRKEDSAVDTWNRLVHGNSRMAVVVDDHFRPVGLITLEEIVEDMIGDEFFNEASDDPEEIRADFERERIRVPGIRRVRHHAQIEAIQAEIRSLETPRTYTRLSGSRRDREEQIERLRDQIERLNQAYYSLSTEQKIEIFEFIWSLFLYESERIEFFPSDAREEGHRQRARQIQSQLPSVFRKIYQRIESRYDELAGEDDNVARIREQIIQEFRNGFFDHELTESEREALKDLYYREQIPSESP